MGFCLRSLSEEVQNVWPVVATAWFLAPSGAFTLSLIRRAPSQTSTLTNTQQMELQDVMFLFISLVSLA